MLRRTAVPTKPRQSVNAAQLLTGLGRLLRGDSPLLSIEITRECPLNCPGCYAYGDNHLGGDGVTLRTLTDLHGDALDGVLDLIRTRRPMQVSFVGGEPLVRHKELSRILPVLNDWGIYSLVVTSGVIPFPAAWNQIPRARVTVSVDGLQPEHDARRAPATYKRILKNLKRCTADISWVVTNQMMKQPGYLEAYLAFWTNRPEIERIWFSIYTPQRGEVSAERLTQDSRRRLLDELPYLKRKFPVLVLPDGVGEALVNPPASPDACTFARISANVSADLKTEIQPCFFGGDPDCSECGCAVSAGLHWLRGYSLAPGLRAGHLIDLAVTVGRHPRRIGRRLA